MTRCIPNQCWRQDNDTQQLFQMRVRSTPDCFGATRLHSGLNIALLAVKTGPYETFEAISQFSQNRS